MPVAITLRDIPDSVRDELAARAARAGMSMQEFLRAMLIEQATRPTAQDVLARARNRVLSTDSRVPSDATLAARDAERR